MFWLKIKILRDINNIKCNKFTDNYKKLLHLIKNIHDIENLNEKLTLSKLNKINLKLLLQISNNNNVEIVTLPVFCTFKLNENKIEQETHSVSTYYSENIIDFFETFNNTKYKIYLYTIDNNIIRSYVDIDNKEYVRLIRNKKIQKINSLV